MLHDDHGHDGGFQYHVTKMISFYCLFGSNFHGFYCQVDPHSYQHEHRHETTQWLFVSFGKTC